MFKIELVDPLPTESVNYIALENIKQADEKHNLQLFISASIGWLKANPTLGYHDLEKQLRENNLNTHLYAAKPREVLNATINIYNDYKAEFSYECIMSCRPKQYALAEVLSVWPSYEINLEHLKLAGSLFIKNKEDDTDKNTYFLSNDENDFATQIYNNKKRINISIMTFEESLQHIEQQIEHQYGIKPVKNVVGMSRDGSPICGFFVNDKRVSEFGIKIGHNSSGEQIQSIIEIN